MHLVLLSSGHFELYLLDSAGKHSSQLIVGVAIMRHSEMWYILFHNPHLESSGSCLSWI